MNLNILNVKSEAFIRSITAIKTFKYIINIKQFCSGILVGIKVTLKISFQFQHLENW